MTNYLDNNAAGIDACAEFPSSLYVDGGRTIKSDNNDITNNNTKRARNNAGKHTKRRQSVYYNCRLRYDNATRVYLSPFTNVLLVYTRIVTVYIYSLFLLQKHSENPMASRYPSPCIQAFMAVRVAPDGIYRQGAKPEARQSALRSRAYPIGGIVIRPRRR